MLQSPPSSKLHQLGSRYQQQPHHHHHHQQHLHQQTPDYLVPFSHYSPPQTPADFSPDSIDASHIDLDFDADQHCGSSASSPVSTQSLLSQYSGGQQAPLSTFDSIPALAGQRVPREFPLFPLAQAPQPSFGEFATSDLMQTDAWLSSGQMTPRTVGRPHQRESSLSSLGSTTGPASPFSYSITSPHIAITDPAGDAYHGLPSEDFYQLSKYSSESHDSLYGNYPAYVPAEPTTLTQYPHLAATPKRRADRGLLAEVPIGSNTPRPLSVASSINSDSPATPAGEPEDERRKNLALNGVPKLHRTITDSYSDELYNPGLIISSAPPAQMPKSPTNSDMFSQRLQAANSQLLNVAQSPAAAVPRGQSPFRNGSSHAPVPVHEFPSTTMASPRVRFPSAQQIREQKVAEGARMLQQQMQRPADTSPPQTISPKDALLDFSEEDESNNFRLFSEHNSNNGNGFDMDSVSKAALHTQHAFDGMSLDSSGFGNFFGPHLGNGISVPQLPQQYPFIPQARQPSSVPSLSNGNGSLATSRVSSVEANNADSMHNSPPRPANTSADGGTYTCTYHGCTLRFDTPALLQKHKREGHRQPHGLNGTRRAEVAAPGMTSALLNTQAGPHKCERINPSTGKPCNTIFSRPYDLTRHEDTIHNARKQKVRCDLCTDEKTFSRADALTRHYRVCHPDVEFPGKQRRRGGHSG